MCISIIKFLNQNNLCHTRQYNTVLRFKRKFGLLAHECDHQNHNQFSLFCCCFPHKASPMLNNKNTSSIHTVLVSSIINHTNKTTKIIRTKQNKNPFSFFQIQQKQERKKRLSKRPPKSLHTNYTYNIQLTHSTAG